MFLFYHLLIYSFVGGGHKSADALGGQKRKLSPLEPELQSIVGHLMWVLWKKNSYS